MRQDQYIVKQAPDATIDNVKREKQQDRLRRQAEFQPGDEFRPYDLFNEYAIVPATLLRCKLLTPGERLCWVAIAKRFGPEGKAFPSYDTLGNDVGVDRRQAIRLVRGLERKRFLRIISRFSLKPNANSSNEFRLLWHPIFAENKQSPSDISSLGSDNLSPPPSGKLTPRGSDNLPPKKNQSSEKNHVLKRETIKATSSDDDAADIDTRAEDRTSGSPLADFISQIRKLLGNRHCVRASFGRTDKELARSLFDQEVPIHQVEHGIRVACLRWYYAALNGDAKPNIGSFKYFEAEIGRAGNLEVSASYREGVKRKLDEAEQQWLRPGKESSNAVSPNLLQGAA